MAAAAPQARACTLTHTPWRGLMVMPLTSASGTCPGSRLNVKRWYIRTSAILASCTP